MYSKNKGGGTSVSSDAQAREKLALYVYEYLIHIGAQKAAQTFLSEIRWEKNITLGEPPGFLHFWWCVFWDLYCAAPERCDTTEQGNKPKPQPFHDYASFVNGAGYPPNANALGGPAGPTPPVPGMGPPTEGIPCNGPGPGSGSAAFYPNNPPMRPTQPSQQPLQQAQPPPQHQQVMSPYMGPRYPPGPRPGPRMQVMQGTDYTGHPGHPSIMANGSDPTNRQMPGGMSQMNSRMNAPMGAMGPMGPRGPPVGPGVPFMGMVPPGGGRPQWQPNTSSPMNNGYPSASPGNYAGAPGSAGHSGPGTPTIASPREAGSNHGADNLYGIVKTEPTATRGGGGGPGEYGSNQGADNLYGMVKTEPTRGNGGSGEYGSNHSAEKLYGMVKAEPTRANGGPGEYGMGGRPSCDGNAQIRGIAQNSIGSVLNNDSLANSPASGPATPRNVGNGTMNDFGLAAFEAQGENGQMESAAILKIKESMQEEAKRFEKGSEQSDFFMR